jgi:hypothetical protein
VPIPGAGKVGPPPPDAAPIPNCPAGCELGPPSATGPIRARRSLAIRRQVAADEFARLFTPPTQPPPCPLPPLPPPVPHPCNGDEVKFAGTFIGSFTKGLPHDPNTGLVDSPAYCRLLRALDTGQGFQNLTLGCAPSTRLLQRKLENPQAGYAFDLQGADSHSLVMPPAPAFYSEDEAAEMLELYWMALARDIPFVDYPPPAGPVPPNAPPLFNAAFNDLNRFLYFNNPPPPRVPLTVNNLFRGFTAGDRKGPYLSQFLLYDVPHGSQMISARNRTLLPGVDYVTGWQEFINVQNGCDQDQTACDPTPRFIRSARDLAQLVHLDEDCYAWFNACNILVNSADPLRRCEAAAGLGAEFAQRLPYNNPRAALIEQFPSPPKSPQSRTQIGVATFGSPHVYSVLFEAVNRALKAVWYQKWLVHRRLRPEEYGGFVHLEATNPGTFPIPQSLFQSPLLNPPAAPSVFDVFQHNALQNNNKRNPPQTGGTYLLPMAYAEGSPLHPSYGAGHATVAGACATVLKAFFDEDERIVNPMVPNRFGTALEPYTGPDRNALTLGDELNKLAGNISLGRNFAGVHWESDFTESLILGEKVAISLLYDQARTFHEAHSFRFRRFNGSPVQIDPTTSVVTLKGLLAPP